MITLEMPTQGCNFSLYHICVSNYTYKLTYTLKIFATVRNIGMEFYFPPLTTVLPILLFCHLPVLIFLLMQFSLSWTLVSSCGAMLMIFSFYVYTIYGMRIYISLSLRMYIPLHLKPDSTSIELKKKTTHMLSFPTLLQDS